MLSFVDSIKYIIYDVQATGGAMIQRTPVSHSLLQRFREYAVEQLSASQTAGKYELLEWFNEGMLEEYVRACTIYLQKLGISDEQRVFDLISRVIYFSVHRGNEPLQQIHSFDGRLLNALIDVWDQLGDDQTVAYMFAQNRWLISWSYVEGRWKVTGLGLLFLELPPAQAISFLLIIDMLCSTGKHDFRHISREALREVYSLQSDSSEFDDLMPYHREILSRLGILEESDDYHLDRVNLTALGKVAIERALARDHPLRDVVKSLFAAEELGNSFQGSLSEINDVVRIARLSNLVDEANRKSVETCAQLFSMGKYLDSLRIIYPSIESVVNAMITQAGEQAVHFRGLTNKVEWLAHQKLIPSDVSSAIEVITRRNKVLHGNFAPPDDYIYPLCLLAFRYLRRLIISFESKGLVITPS